MSYRSTKVFEKSTTCSTPKSNFQKPKNFKIKFNQSLEYHGKMTQKKDVLNEELLKLLFTNEGLKFISTANKKLTKINFRFNWNCENGIY